MLNTFRGVPRFITGTLSIAAEACATDSVGGPAKLGVQSAGAAEVSTILALLRILSAETTGQLEDSPSGTTKPGHVREHLAASSGAGRRGAFRRAEALALVAEGFTAAGAGNRSFVKFPGNREF
jgi:hypothetical protein